MRRELPGGLELDDDRARVDAEVVHRYLSEESYWAAGRRRETVDRLIREASRIVSLYDDGATVGFCRVVSDDATLAILLDVFVLTPYRGHGLGKELVAEAVDRGPHASLPWHLGTRDAQGLYRRFGFGEPNMERHMFRPGTRRN